MDEVRHNIDRLDSELVTLLAERFTYVERAWQLKSSPSEARVPWRIEAVIARVRETADQKGFPAELAERVWRSMIEYFIDYEVEKIGAAEHRATDSKIGAPVSPTGTRSS